MSINFLFVLFIGDVVFILCIFKLRQFQWYKYFDLQKLIIYYLLSTTEQHYTRFVSYVVVGSEWKSQLLLFALETNIRL